MKATGPNGELLPIPDCIINIPNPGSFESGGTIENFTTVYLNNLPEISYSKKAEYSDEVVIGRALPIKTYSHSDNKVINMQIHLFSQSTNEANQNIQYLRALESALYPRESKNYGYRPPVVCYLKCGRMLGDDGLCAILISMNVKMPTNVAWDESSMLPRKVDVDLIWDVAYSSDKLPNQSKIFQSGA